MFTCALIPVMEFSLQRYLKASCQFEKCGCNEWSKFLKLPEKILCLIWLHNDMVVSCVTLVECSELPCQLQNRVHWQGCCRKTCAQFMCTFQLSFLYAWSCKCSSSALSWGLLKHLFLFFIFFVCVLGLGDKWKHPSYV